jgi:hypothetical protein
MRARAVAAAKARWAAATTEEKQEAVEKLVAGTVGVRRGIPEFKPASVETAQERMQREFIERQTKKGRGE